MPSRVTAAGMFWWGVGLLVAGVLAGVLPYQLMDSGTLVGAVLFQWVWQLLSVLQYLGGALVAVSLGVRALESRLAPPAPDQAFAEPGPYGPGGGHPNPQP
ncbi:hypothetical protein ACWFNE_13080 [Cellulomonas sp. NPDC055163]